MKDSIEENLLVASTSYYPSSIAQYRPHLAARSVILLRFATCKTQAHS